LAHSKLVETPSGVLGIHLCHSYKKVSFIFTFCNIIQQECIKVKIYVTSMQ
jgi:hypothetical protein